jgi:hypothetical protein
MSGGTVATDCGSCQYNGKQSDGAGGPRRDSARGHVGMSLVLTLQPLPVTLGGTMREKLKLRSDGGSSGGTIY